MQARHLSPGRIVALALITLVAAGLAYLRFAPDSVSVSVPEGAKAGDLALESCEYATENGSYAADCGTLVVPENRNDPKSRLIALPVTRIKAKSDHPAEPLFRLQGGPGVTNMQFKPASRFAGDRDVVLVGYRGVDGSRTTASTSPVTRSPSGSTTSRPRASRSATTASTSSARAPARATRWSMPGATRPASTATS